MKIFVKCLAVILLFVSLQTTAHGARRIIIDTDMGGDDAAAIIFAAKTPSIKIEGITVVSGNTTLEQAAKNALMTLEITGTNAQVYKGTDKSFTGVENETVGVYGADGLGDAGLIHPKTSVNEKSAVDFILETVKANPDEIEIILIGPATNVALAIDKDPVTMSRVKKFWSMGTSGFGQGNATPVAEFNVYKDAEAYKILLDSGVPTTILGLDMATPDTLFSEKTLDDMKKKSPLNKFVAVANGKLLEYSKQNLNQDSVYACDPLLMAAVVWDDFILETETCQRVA